MENKRFFVSSNKISKLINKEEPYSMFYDIKSIVKTIACLSKKEDNVEINEEDTIIFLDKGDSRRELQERMVMSHIKPSFDR